MEQIDVLYVGHQTRHLDDILAILSKDYHPNLILPNVEHPTADTLVIPSDGGYNVNMSAFSPHYKFPSKLETHSAYLSYFIDNRLELLDTYSRVIVLHETAYSLWVSVLGQKIRWTESGALEIVENSKVAFTSRDEGILFLTPTLCGLTHFSPVSFKLAISRMAKKDPPDSLFVFANINV